MEKILKATIRILVIIALILFICVAFFGFNPVTDTINKIKASNKAANERKIVVDGVTLRVDSPEFTYDRFNGITYSASVEDLDETAYVVADFQDDSGYINWKCYKVIQNTPANSKTLCDECSNKTSGKIYCNIKDYDGGQMIGAMSVSWEGHSAAVGNDDINNLIKAYVKEPNEIG